MDFPWTLFREALETGRTYLPRFREAMEQSGHLFQEGREGEAVSLFNQLLDGLEWLGSLVDSMELVTRQDLAELPDAEHICRASASFRTLLRELQVAFENADYVLMGDLLTYELTPLLAEWENIVLAVGEYLQRSPQMG